MANIVNFSTFKPQTYRISLRRFYRDLDRTVIPPPDHQQDYQSFVYKIRGRFLEISRKKKNISLEDAAHYFGVLPACLNLIENGRAPIHDTAFQKLCIHYGTLQEAVTLRKKMERLLLRKIFEKNP